MTTMAGQRAEKPMSAFVYGAGSAGNHIAHALRVRGHRVRVWDPDAAARTRMQREIYPARYGAWDEAIELAASSSEVDVDVDAAFIAAPPDVHLECAEQALARFHALRLLIVEKPLTRPTADDVIRADALARRCTDRGVRLCVGYNHRAAASVQTLVAWLRAGRLGGAVTALDVEFREHWGGIFAAHPWLRGPSDSYLGFTSRGGGAIGEHSHALDLWLHLAHAADESRVKTIDARLEYPARSEATAADTTETAYDERAVLALTSTSGLRGTVVQDVVTQPAIKRVTVRSARHTATLSLSATMDVLALDERETQFPKTRADDFLAEVDEVARVFPLDHTHACLFDYAAVRDTVIAHAAAVLANERGAVDVDALFRAR